MLRDRTYDIAAAYELRKCSYIYLQAFWAFRNHQFGIMFWNGPGTYLRTTIKRKTHGSKKIRQLTLREKELLYEFWFT